MKRTDATPMLYFIGTVMLLGTAACLFVYKCFGQKDFEFDTYDEHSEDYL